MNRRAPSIQDKVLCCVTGQADFNQSADLISIYLMFRVTFPRAIIRPPVAIENLTLGAGAPGTRSLAPYGSRAAGLLADALQCKVVRHDTEH